jgi:predicted Holliday junction resolvase-like endonuclease
MDFFSIIVWIIIIYVLWTLISVISSLRNEIREMKNKCIINNQNIQITEDDTQDPKKILLNTFNFMKNIIL